MSEKEKLKIKISKNKNSPKIMLIIEDTVKHTPLSELVTFATYTDFHSVKIYVFPKHNFYKVVST